MSPLLKAVSLLHPHKQSARRGTRFARYPTLCGETAKDGAPGFLLPVDFGAEDVVGFKETGEEEEDQHDAGGPVEDLHG